MAIFIGTSGWLYKDWDKEFYPQEVGSSSEKRLIFLSSVFPSVEINNTFYNLPSRATFKKWHSLVPNNFVFSVKLSRYITHIKRIEHVKMSLRKFLDFSAVLEDKLGPILVQFPSWFRRTEEREKRMKKFLSDVVEISGGKQRIALELRHDSWFNEEIYEMAGHDNTSLVFSRSKAFPSPEVVTANFIYLRMHGSELYRSNYTKKELKKEAENIKEWAKKRLDVYVYFNNDVGGHAAHNAKQLNDLVRG